MLKEAAMNPSIHCEEQRARITGRASKLLTLGGASTWAKEVVEVDIVS